MEKPLAIQYMYIQRMTCSSHCQVLCAAPVNPVTFLSDHDRAITVNKRVTPPPEGVATEKGRPPVHVPADGEESMSIVWIITGVPNLTKVRTCIHDVIDQKTSLTIRLT